MNRVLGTALLCCSLVTLRVAAAPPGECEDGKPAEWCAAKMVALRIETPSRTMRVRIEEGGRIPWHFDGWKFPLFLRADRLGTKGLRLSVATSEGGPHLTEALLKKGEALVLSAGRQLPADFFHPPAATTQIRIVAEE